MNALSFSHLSAGDFNIFFTICYFVSKHIKNKGLKSIMKDFKEQYNNELIKIFQPKDVNFDEKMDKIKYFLINTNIIILKMQMIKN